MLDDLLPSFLPPVTPGLYIVATPIGNLGDISLRALSVLKACHSIACEDTRISKKLLTAYGISKPLLIYHDHNGEAVRPLLIEKLKDNQIIALISDAGTPLISDPGYKLVRQCQAENLKITTIPGACSVISALVISGQPTNQFYFVGFAEAKIFPSLSPLLTTLIFFESASRLVATLQNMSRGLKGREISVVRELTKMYEEVQKGSPEQLIEYYTKTPPRGEVVLIAGPPTSYENEATQDKLETALKEALQTYRVKEAVTMVAGSFGVSKKDVYTLALTLKTDIEC